MSKDRNKLLSRNLQIRVSPEQWARLHQQSRSTTCHGFAEYIRDLLDRKPVTIRYRNQSLDEFLLVALALKNELQTISKNFHQAIQQLKSLPPRVSLNNAIDFLAAEEFSLRDKTDEIKDLLSKMYDLWLQK